MNIFLIFLLTNLISVKFIDQYQNTLFFLSAVFLSYDSIDR
jgi:hypothetical protein